MNENIRNPTSSEILCKITYEKMMPEASKVYSIY